MDQTEQTAVARKGPSPDQPPTPPSVPIGTTGADQRYVAGAPVGCGGMGEVRYCSDEVLGRLVAIKQLRREVASDPDMMARFVREARIQALLDHPAVPPVYDAGVVRGRLFFTMKHVRGRTLADVITSLRRRDAATRGRFSRRRLLTAFSQVCLAVDVAHSHGIVHRDLKPTNLMFGEHGEPYVLDWGIAKILGHPDELGDLASSPPEPLTATQTGAKVGTAGYMAPEQISSEYGEVGPRTDVYALGAILFELLTLDRLHPGDSETRERSTLQGVDPVQRAQVTAAGGPPELLDLCARATAGDPADRPTSARALHEAIERYLDGQRDAALRARLAAEHLHAGRAAAERALGPSGGLEDRRRALAEVGRALALDPAAEEPRRLLLQVLTAPPRDVPAAVTARVERTRSRSVDTMKCQTALTYAAMLLGVPFCLAMGVRDATAFAVTIVTIFAVVAAASIARERGRVVVVAITGAVAVGSLSGIFGPFLLVTPLAVGFAIAQALNVGWRLPAAIGCASVAVPLALQWLGVLPVSYAFDGEGMHIMPHMLELPRVPSLAFLAFASFATIVIGAYTADRYRRVLHRARIEAALREWQLEQTIRM